MTEPAPVPAVLPADLAPCPAPPAPLSPRAVLRQLPAYSPVAALELETAPTPLLALLPAVLLGLLVVLAAWAWASEVDIVSTAPGRLVPSARVKVVQPLEPGVVRAVLVKEGTWVKAGQPVVELDPTESEADRTRLAHDLQVASAEAARLRLLLAALAEGERVAPVYAAPEGTAEAVVAAQRRLLDSQWRRLMDQRLTAAREQARLRTSIEANTAQQAKNRAVAAVLKERVSIRATLAAQELMPRGQLLELRQAQVEHEQEAEVLKVTQRQTEADLAAAQARQQQAEEEARERFLAELNEKERALASLASELRKAEQRESRRTLLAPVAGTVVDLAVHTVGGVVKEAEPLLRVVPEDEKLEVEVAIRPRDIGFIRVGQAVSIKVDTFPYTRYGTLEGRVIDIAADSSSNGGGNDPSTATYKVKVLPERSSMWVDGQEVELTAGMTVTVDVKTGQRRVIDYLLDPLTRYRLEAMRER